MEKTVYLSLLLLWPASVSTSCGLGAVTRVNSALTESLPDDHLLITLQDYVPDAKLVLRVRTDGEDLGNDTVHKFCVGLVSFKRTYHGPLVSYCDEDITFNSNVTVGYVVIDRSCQNSDRWINCRPEVWISEQVWSLNLFQLDSSYVDYWNFDSELYRPERDWLQYMSFTPTDKQYSFSGMCHVPLVSLSGLSNTSVRSLSLTGNWPVQEPGLTLGPMPRLRYLALVDTGIADFREDAYKYMPALEELILTRNQITAMPSNLGKFKNLKRLIVSRNINEVFDNFTFDSCSLEGMHALEELDVSHNNIVHIVEILPMLPSLTILNLSSNLLESVGADGELFSNAPSLSVVDLSSNYISHLPVKSFYNQRGMRHVNLSSNKLTDWPVLYGHSIEMLDVSHNNISQVLPCEPKSAVLDLVDASDNIISDWTISNVFGRGYNRCVRSANLSSNGFRSLRWTMIQSLEELDWVDLGGNPFDCDYCDTGAVQGWLRSSDRKTRVLRFGRDAPLLCSSPGAQRGLAVVSVELDRRGCRRSWNARLSMLVLGIVVVLALIVGAVLYRYRYRYEIVKLLHLIQLRKKVEERILTPENEFTA